MAARGNAGISANARRPRFDHSGRDSRLLSTARGAAGACVAACANSALKSHWLSDRSPLPLHYTLAHRQSAAAADLAHWVERALALRSFSIF